MSMIYNYNRQLTAGYGLLKYFSFSKKRKKYVKDIQLRDNLFPFSNNFLNKNAKSIPFQEGNLKSSEKFFIHFSNNF